MSLLEAGISVNKKSEKLGEVGEPSGQHQSPLADLVEQGYFPIISSIGISDKGELLNVNADEAAAAIAEQLGAELIFLTDVSAVLDGQMQPINQLNPQQLSELVGSGVINGGMKVKVETAMHAAEQLNRGVYISSWQQPKQVAALITGTGTFGTQILPRGHS